MEEKFYVIERHDSYIWIQFRRGTQVNPDMILEAIDQLNALYKNQHRRDLWDFRGCMPSADFGYDAMTRIVDNIQSRAPSIWAEMTALLIDDTILYGLSRMYQIIADGYPTEIGIFQNEADARRWIAGKTESEANKL
jgi:hypothetical protein